MEEQEHLGGPLAEAADRDDLLDRLLVGELVEPIQLELAGDHMGGEVAQVLDLAAREARSAQRLLLGLQQLLGGRRPAAEDVEHAQVDGARRFGRELLADDRPQQRPVGVLRALLAAPCQPRRQVDLADPLDQRRHHRVGRGQRRPCAHRPFQTGLRFSAKAAIPSRKSSEAKQDSRSAISPASWASLSTGLRASVSIALLLPRIESGALAAIAAASSTDLGLQRLVGDDFVDQADLLGAGRLDVAAGEEELLGPRQADRVDELAQPGVAVDEAELRGRHAELGAGGADPQVAADRELQARRPGSGR